MSQSSSQFLSEHFARGTCGICPFSPFGLIRSHSHCTHYMGANVPLVWPAAAFLTPRETAAQLIVEAGGKQAESDTSCKQRRINSTCGPWRRECASGLSTSPHRRCVASDLSRREAFQMPLQSTQPRCHLSQPPASSRVLARHMSVSRAHPLPAGATSKAPVRRHASSILTRRKLPLKLGNARTRLSTICSLNPSTHTTT